MKAITTLTAIAALVAGMSIASAQMSPSGPSSSGVSGTTGSSTPQAATGSGQFCIETSKSGGMNCKYASMAACEKDAQAQGLKCSPNPNKSTTGSKQ